MKDSFQGEKINLFQGEKQSTQGFYFYFFIFINKNANIIIFFL